MLRAEHEAGRGEVADARADRLAAAKKVADAVAERDLARQMLKGVQAMLGHAEAARSSAQRALQQAQAEKAASQVCHPEHTSSPLTISLQTCQAYISTSPGALICSAPQQAEKASVRVCSHPQYIPRAHIPKTKACTVQGIRWSNRQMALLLSGLAVSPAITERPTHVQAVLAESEARRNRHAQELEDIRASRKQVEAQLAAAEAKLAATQVALAKVRHSCPVHSRRPATVLRAILEPRTKIRDGIAPASIAAMPSTALQ